MASQAEVDLVVDTSDTLADLERDLREIVASAQEDADAVEIDALLNANESLSGLISDLDHIIDLAERANDPIAVQAILDDQLSLSELQDELQDLIETAEETAEQIQLDAELEADLAQLDAELAALVEDLERDAPPVELEVEVDRDGSLSRTFTSLGRAAANLLPSIGRLAGGIGAVGLAAGSAVPLLAGVVTTVQAIAPAAALAVSGLLTVQLAAGTLKLAMQGVGEAVTAALDPATKPEELEAALKGLAPSARAFVVQLSSMREQFKSLQQDVQQTFFQDLDTVLKDLGTTAFPVVANAARRTSQVLNVMAKEAGRAASNLAKDGVLGKALDSSVASLDNLSLVPGQVVKGLGQIAAAAGPSLERLSAAAADAATRVSDKLSAAFESGALEEAIDGAVDAIAQLGRIAGNVFGGLGNIIGTVSDESGGLFSVLEKVTQAFEDVTATQGFQQALKALTQTANVIVDTALPLLSQILQALGPVFLALAAPVQLLVRALGDGLSKIVTALGPVLVSLGNAFGQLVIAVTPLIDLAARLIAALLPALVPLFDALGQVINAAVPFIEKLASILITALVPIFTTLATEVLPKILPPLVEMTTLIFPILTQILEKLAPIVTRFAETFAELLVELAPVLAELAKLQVALAEELLPILQPILNGIIALIEIGLKILTSQIANILIPTLRILVDFLKGDFDAAWKGAKELIRDLAQKAQEFIRGMVEGIGIQLSNLVRAVSEKAAQLVTSFLDKIRKGGDDAVADFRSLPGRIASSLGNTATHLIQAGADLVQGFIDGIASKIGRLREIAQELANTVAGSVKDFLGIQSPSRLMREVGNDTMDGMILGIADKVPDLRSELQGVAALAPSFALPNGQTLRLPDFGASAAPAVQVFIGNEEFNGHIDTRVTQANTARDRLIVTGVRR